MKSKLITTKEIIRLIKESTSRYAVNCSTKDYTSYVQTLSDAVKLVKQMPDNSRVTITDTTKNNAKVVFGPKKTALEILVKICNKNPYS